VVSYGSVKLEEGLTQWCWDSFCSITCVLPVDLT